jgi:hypothetical protein
MKNENSSKDSPFYVEYAGTTKGTKTYGYHVRKDFEKPLKEFLDARFGGLSDNEVMEQLVYDYYFRFAHDRTYYGKTIIALMHEKELAAVNPKIIPMYVANRFPRNSKYDEYIDGEIIHNYKVMQYIAFIDKFEDATDVVKKNIVYTIFNDGFEIDKYDVFDKLKNFNEDSLKEFFVLEIPLNNYLDAEKNGIYCFEDTDNNEDAVEHMHVGLAIVKGNDKYIEVNPFPMIYAWSLEHFEVIPHIVSRVSLKDLHYYCQKFNTMLNMVVRFSEIENLGVDFKISENRREQAKLRDALTKLEKQEQELLEIKRDESTGEK